MFEHVRTNTPEILWEWSKISLRQKRRLKQVREEIGQDCNPINIGPYTRHHIHAFGAKVACALYYDEVKQVLPSTGGIYVETITVDKFLRGGVYNLTS